jgi:hypothetical protein
LVAAIGSAAGAAVAAAAQNIGAAMPARTKMIPELDFTTFPRLTTDD